MIILLIRCIYKPYITYLYTVKLYNFHCHLQRTCHHMFQHSILLLCSLLLTLQHSWAVYSTAVRGLHWTIQSTILGPRNKHMCVPVILILLWIVNVGSESWDDRVDNTPQGKFNIPTWTKRPTTRVVHTIFNLSMMIISDWQCSNSGAVCSSNRSRAITERERERMDGYRWVDRWMDTKDAPQRNWQAQQSGRTGISGDKRTLMRAHTLVYLALPSF